MKAAEKYLLLVAARGAGDSCQSMKQCGGAFLIITIIISWRWLWTDRWCWGTLVASASPM